MKNEQMSKLGFVVFVLSSITVQAQHFVMLGPGVAIPINWGDKSTFGPGGSFKYEFQFSKRSSINATAAYYHFENEPLHPHYAHIPFRIGYGYHFSKYLSAFTQIGYNNTRTSYKVNHWGIAWGTGICYRLNYSKRFVSDFSFGFNYDKYPFPGYHYLFFNLGIGFGIELGNKKN